MQIKSAPGDRQGNAPQAPPALSALPAPYIVEPYAPHPSGVVLGWYRVTRRGEEEIAVVKDEERARAWAALENRRAYERYLTTEEGRASRGEM